MLAHWTGMAAHEPTRLSGQIKHNLPLIALVIWTSQLAFVNQALALNANSLGDR